MTVDPILALESLGYTEREAAFLYLVAIHSGHFVRRQFDYFTDRNKGALVMRFLEKARVAGHIEFLDYRQGWHVYHLFSKLIYRMLGDAESQHRRKKGDAHVRAQLMALDYVLENLEDHYLESEAEKIDFFTETRGIAPEIFTGSDRKLFPLLASFPVSVADRTRPAHSLVRFAFIDEGLATTTKFLRFLAQSESLLRAVGNFELVYVSASAFHFPAAKDAFWKRFSKAAPRSPRLFDGDTRSVAAEDRTPVHPRFTTLLLGYSYPRLQRSEVRGSIEGSRISE